MCGTILISTVISHHRRNIRRPFLHSFSSLHLIACTTLWRTRTIIIQRINLDFCNPNFQIYAYHSTSKSVNVNIKRVYHCPHLQTMLQHTQTRLFIFALNAGFFHHGYKLLTVVQLFDIVPTTYASSCYKYLRDCSNIANLFQNSLYITIPWFATFIKFDDCMLTSRFCNNPLPLRSIRSVRFWKY